MKTRTAILSLVALLATPSLAVQPLPICWPADINGTGSIAVFGETVKTRYSGWKCLSEDKKTITAYSIVALKSRAFSNPGVTNLHLNKVAEKYWTSNVKLGATDSSLKEGFLAVADKLKFVQPPGLALDPAISSHLPGTVQSRSLAAPSPQFTLNPAGVPVKRYSEEEIKLAPVSDSESHNQDGRKK